MSGKHFLSSRSLLGSTVAVLLLAAASASASLRRQSRPGRRPGRWRCVQHILTVANPQGDRIRLRDRQGRPAGLIGEGVRQGSALGATAQPEHGPLRLAAQRHERHEDDDSPGRVSSSSTKPLTSRGTDRIDKVAARRVGRRASASGAPTAFSFRHLLHAHVRARSAPLHQAEGDEPRDRRATGGTTGTASSSSSPNGACSGLRVPSYLNA